MPEDNYEISDYDAKGEALIWLVHEGDEKLNEIKELLDSGADIEYILKSSSGYNGGPLTMAAYAGHIGIVKELIKRGANPNAINKYGSPPLMAAVAGRSKEVIKTLIIGGANVDYLDPLMLAIITNDIVKVREALSAGANINRFDEDAKRSYYTPLTLAIQLENDEIFTELLSQGADINYMNEYSKNSPLIQAARDGNRKTVETLLDRGVDTNQVDSIGYSALHEANARGDQEIAKLLISYGADVSNFEPLELAIMCGDIAKVREAISAGANVNKVFEKGPQELSRNKHPLTLAAFFGNEEIITELLDQGAKVNQLAYLDYSKSSPLMIAADRGHKGVVEILLARGADINQVDRHGHNALFYSNSSRTADPHKYNDIIALLKQTMEHKAFKAAPIIEPSGTAKMEQQILAQISYPSITGNHSMIVAPGGNMSRMQVSSIVENASSQVALAGVASHM
jgi:ankyrin repeat protein